MPRPTTDARAVKEALDRFLDTEERYREHCLILCGAGLCKLAAGTIADMQISFRFGQTEVTAIQEHEAAIREIFTNARVYRNGGEQRSFAFAHFMWETLGAFAEGTQFERPEDAP